MNDNFEKNNAYLIGNEDDFIKIASKEEEIEEIRDEIFKKESALKKLKLRDRKFFSRFSAFAVTTVLFLIASIIGGKVSGSDTLTNVLIGCSAVSFASSAIASVGSVITFSKIKKNYISIFNLNESLFRSNLDLAEMKDKANAVTLNYSNTENHKIANSDTLTLNDEKTKTTGFTRVLKKQ